mmetsp:Transcript_78220/g.242925  ORF Transcript_78220/g.242925 Transcript_78220/m.242925 type:complete len:237 (-) Transcript_78220:184-894(-)
MQRALRAPLWLLCCCTLPRLGLASASRGGGPALQPLGLRRPGRPLQAAAEPCGPWQRHRAAMHVSSGGPRSNVQGWRQAIFGIREHDRRWCRRVDPKRGRDSVLACTGYISPDYLKLPGRCVEPKFGRVSMLACIAYTFPESFKVPGRCVELMRGRVSMLACVAYTSPESFKVPCLCVELMHGRVNMLACIAYASPGSFPFHVVVRNSCTGGSAYLLAVPTPPRSSSRCHAGAWSS